MDCMTFPSRSSFGMFRRWQSFIGAGVVAVDLAGGTVAAHTAHEGTAGAVELAGQDVVRFRFILCLELTVQFQHGLCPLPKFIVDNGRNGSFNAHVIRFADVHAAIGFVLDDSGNAALVEGVALTGAQSFGVELSTIDMADSPAA